MLIAGIIIIQIIINVVVLIGFLIDYYDRWGNWAKELYEAVEKIGLINGLCEDGIKIKHIFILWFFIYDLILLVGFVKLKKLGEITLIKRK